MKNKLLVSTVVAVSLLAPAVAFAQSDTAASPDTAAPHATKMKAHHAKSTHMKPGTTTGMSSKSHAGSGGKSTTQKPASSY